MVTVAKAAERGNVQTHDKKKHQVAIMVIFTLLIVMMFGCSTEDARDVNVGENQMSLERVRVTDMGFKFIASRGDALATITVQRTQQWPEEYNLDPQIDSPYEVDVILRNRHGFPFVTNSGHGTPVDPDDGDLSMVPKVRFVHQEQLDDLQLIIDAVDVFAVQPELIKDFSWEIRLLHEMASFSLQNANNIIDGSSVPQTSPDVQAVSSQLKSWTEIPAPSIVSTNSPDGQFGTTTSALSGPFTHQVMIRKGPCFFCGDSGEHSAVLLNVYYDSGGYVGSSATQNHGRSAYDSSMSNAFNCPQAYSGRSTAFPNFQPYMSSDTYAGGDAGGCHTSYGVWSGRHVCNDDSQAQYNNIKYNLSGTWWFCEDSSLAYWAPYCN